jgi:hypothetical protein
MAKAPKNWERRLVELAAIHGVTDFLMRGRLTKAESKVFYTILNKLGKPAARAGATGLARLPGTIRYVAMRHPLGAAVALTYVAVKNRKKIAELAGQGYEIVEEVTEPAREEIVERGRQLYEIAEEAGVYEQRPGITTGRFGTAIQERLGLPTMPKRKKSKYNKAVSAAMKAVKASTKGGKRGTISNPKSVFKTVSKAVSKVNKGAKASAKGVTGIAAKAARKILGRGKKKPKKTKGYTITVNR